MTFISNTISNDFHIDIEEYSIFNKTNSVDFFNFEDNNLDNTYFQSSENKLFEIEINDLSNKNFEFLFDSKNNIQIKKKIKFISQKELDDKNPIVNNSIYLYRKDAYYKHFKSLFSQYIKNKANRLKNICFPNFSKRNFFAISSKYTGNPKENDNLKFLSFSIKDLLSYGKDEKLKNRQYSNHILIKCLEKKELATKDKAIYFELINFLSNSVENEIINFYEDHKIIKNDSKCLFFDEHYKRQTNISLIERNGFLKMLKSKY